MIDTMLPLLLDGLLILLLIATIVYAMILNKKLNRLRGNHDEMEVFVDKMNVACARAEAATAGLRSAGESGKAVFRESMTKAEALRDELVFLVERADIVAGRLASASEGTSVISSQQAAAPQEGGKRTAQKPRPAAAAAPARRPADPARPTASRSEGAGERKAGAPRSEAEEELLKALRNAR